MWRHPAIPVITYQQNFHSIEFSRRGVHTGTLEGLVSSVLGTRLHQTLSYSESETQFVRFEDSNTHTGISYYHC